MARKKTYSSIRRKPRPPKKRARTNPAETTEVATKEKESVVGPEVEPTIINLPSFLTVAQLAQSLKATPVNVVKQLMRLGVMSNVTQLVDYETMANIAVEFGFKAHHHEIEVTKREIEVELPDDEQKDLALRPPIVTILGHVDHGKTSLLDAIRLTNVVDKEVGGITQRIGAYQIEYRDQQITFIDTPGHEAFTSMRARGTNITDIVILVVAADDGVMPQTVEAINHALAAKVPIVVAINKIDRPNADLDKVKRQLAERNIVIEEWGGDTIVVPVSAKEGTGLADLLEALLVVAEVADLKAEQDVDAAGVIVEAQLHQTKGSLATVLIQSGTLRIGDYVVASHAMGRIKAITSDQGHRIVEAGPSTPVEIMGLDMVPSAGDSLKVVLNERAAKEMVKDRVANKDFQRDQSISLETLYAKISVGKLKDLALIVKADTQGSLEVLCDVLSKIETEQGKVKIIHSGSGNVSESDVSLAVASKALIVGFNVRSDRQIEKIAQAEGIEVRHYNIIYELVEDLQKALAGLLEPVSVETIIGHAEVRQVFKNGKKPTIAGCYISDGKVTRSSSVRVIRKDQEIFTGSIKGLKRFKDDVREVAVGYECGIRIDGFDETLEGDSLSFFVIQTK